VPKPQPSPKRTQTTQKKVGNDIESEERKAMHQTNQNFESLVKHATRQENSLNQTVSNWNNHFADKRSITRDLYGTRPQYFQNNFVDSKNARLSVDTSKAGGRESSKGVKRFKIKSYNYTATPHGVNT
jgi:hypothetical protein